MNRIIMPALILNFPIHGIKLGEEWKRFYRRRAEGGAGLIIVGACYVHSAGRQDPFQIGVDHDSWLPELGNIAQVIKKGSAVPALQLNHAGRYALRKITGMDPVAPSDIPSRYTGDIPRELSTGEVEAIIGYFAEAALRAQKAGFEAVELLGATGYLISQFLSPVTNQRMDRYGGGFDERLTFVKELIEAIKGEVGRDYPIIFRLSSKDNVPGGLDADDQRKVARRLAEWGVDLINVTAGWHDAPIPQIASSVPQGYFIPYASKIKEEIEIPVSCAVRITTPDLARRAIAHGQLDMVTLGRALIADPDWPSKAAAEDDQSIRQCICCNHCFDRAFARTRTECSINAQLGREDFFSVQESKHILVIGGGPAGLEAARILALRGHKVVIQEKGNALGGKLTIASVPPYKKELAELTRYQSHELRRLGVEVKMNEEFGELWGHFDGIIVASGAREKTITIKGVEHIPYYKSSEILSEEVEVKDPIVIVGAGLVGGETADFLCSKGFKVSMVEILDEPFSDMGVSLRWVLLGRLKKRGVTICTASEVLEIRVGEVLVRTPERDISIPAGCVITAIGFEPERDVVEKVAKTGVSYCVIGDSKEPRRIKDAVHEGYWAATEWVDGLSLKRRGNGAFR